MKKTIKIILAVIIVPIVFLLGFIITLEAFEYRPDDIKDLAVNGDIDKTPSVSDTISLLTFNIGYASLSKTEDFILDGGTKTKMDSKSEVRDNLDGLLGIVESQSADITLLQEVDIDSRRSYFINQKKTFTDAMDTNSAFAYNYRCIFVPFPLNPAKMMGKVDSGILTLSSFALEEAKRHQLPGSYDWPISLAHLKRAILITIIDLTDSDHDLVVINVHLSAYDDGTMRQEEMAYLRGVLEERKENGDFVIVGGDFNQTFPQAMSGDDYLYPLKDPDLWEAYPMDKTWFEDNGFSFGVDPSTPTCRLLHQPLDTENDENNQYYVIDGFIVSNNIEILSVKTLEENFTYSDHNPVYMEIELLP